MRQLMLMWDGKRKDAWDRTSLIASILHNSNVEKEKDKVDNLHYHPYYYKKKRKSKPPKKPRKIENVAEILQAVFCGGPRNAKHR